MVTKVQADLELTISAELNGSNLMVRRIINYDYGNQNRVN